MTGFQKMTIAFCTIITMVAPTFAGDAELTVSLPTNVVPKPITVQISRPGLPLASVPVMIPPGTTVIQKRNLVVAALNAAGFTATAPAEPNKAIITGLPAGSTVGMIDGGTGEIKDGVATGGEAGGVNFPGFFPPMNYQNLPAIFTAGIVTDVGELTVQVSASELNFQTEGPIICQALFQRLAPRAPQYGAQINLIGDRLEVYFDPAYTVTQGGIIFGTTSPGQGAQGYMIVPPAQPPQILGDMNGDGVANGGDIQPFIDAIMDPTNWNQNHPGGNMMNGDFNGDGAVTPGDMAEFIQELAH